VTSCACFPAVMASLRLFFVDWQWAGGVPLNQV
jgi:hypothetical protein